MEFSFQTQIKETPGAVNTAAKIADILEKSEISFSTLKKPKGVPGIWIKFPEEEKSKLVAHMEDGEPENAYFFECKQGGWWMAYSANPFRHGMEIYLFEHLTDSAKTIVDTFIVALCEEYQSRLDADTIPA